MDFEIGKIVNTQGLGGHVRVFPLTYDPSRFSLLKAVFVVKNGVKTTYEIDSVRYHKKFVIIKFKTVNTIEEAAALKNMLITIPEEEALPLGDGEYYLRDLYDCEVFEQNGERLGVLTDILQTGANDVYTVSDGTGGELYIPAIKQCVISVDIREKKIIVKLLEGLRN